jgi:hypothetical protein
MRVAVTSTNKEDVERLNARLNRSFNPDNHFSSPLTPSRLEKIRAVFAKHGAVLDPDKVKTMSQVRQAAKAHWARTHTDKPFGNVGVISGQDLVIAGHRFTIEKNGDRECIRVQIAGKRRRLYLDEIKWIAGLVGEGGPPHNTTTESSIGELAYPPEQPENPQISSGQISGLAYRVPALADRIAKLKVAQPTHSTTSTDGTDPLEL